ncbi:MAG: hypothetical protein R3220_08805 [Balneolaceae bacterium]|nr:hypothetical protein [Balneolaceae bacterium]
MPSIFQRITQKLGITKEDNAYRLIDISHRLQLPTLTAYAWSLLIDEMEEVPQNRNSDKRILIISKSGGLEDVIESLKGEPIDAKVDLISRSVFKKSAHYYLRDGIGEQNYITDDPETEKNKIRYRNFLKRVLTTFSERYGCDVIIQFNYFYTAEREVAAASSEVGIRFLTAHKECLNSEPIQNYKIERLKDKFGVYEGYKISVYNESQKQVVVQSGFADESRVNITGCPRVNASHRKREIIPTQGSRTTILYYLIHEVAGLPIYKVEENGRTHRGVDKNGRISNWESMIEEVNSTLVNIAESNPDLRIIFKAKTGVVRNQLGNFDIDALPENIEIVKGGVGHDLLDESHIVVGFNSTAVLEAMAAGRKTIVPFFKDLLNPELYPYAIDMEDGVTKAETKEKFKQVLEEAIKDPKIKRTLGPNQIRMLDKYLGNGDGLADERYRKFIEDALYTDPHTVMKLQESK